MRLVVSIAMTQRQHMRGCTRTDLLRSKKFFALLNARMSLSCSSRSRSSSGFRNFAFLLCAGKKKTAAGVSESAARL